MKKRILHIIVFIISVTGLALLMGFANGKQRDLLCTTIDVRVSDSLTSKFVTEAAIRNLLLNSGFSTQGYPLLSIQTRELEDAIEKNPYVSNAEVYTTVEGTLFVSIDQRKALFRVMPNQEPGYYIDKDGFRLPLALNYNPMMLLITGNIPRTLYLDQQGEKVSGEAGEKLLEFAGHIVSDPFWNQQIVQVYCNNDGDFELIPRVGAHQIIFGSLDNYREKLENLKLLYDQGFKKYGWNTYGKINLKYANQIICTKR